MSRSIMAATAVALSTLVVSPLAGAQALNPARFDDANHIVSGGFGVDGPITADVSYAPIVPFPLLDRRLALPIRFFLPMRPYHGDYGLSTGAQLATIGRHGFGLSGRLDLSLRRESTEVASFTRIGGGLTFLGGYFRERGSVALELGWEPGLATRVSPSDSYKRQTYPGAHSTWMGFGNGFLRAGVQGVVRVAGNTELTLRTGVTRTEQLNRMDLLPFYAMVGINQGF